MSKKMIINTKALNEPGLKPVLFCRNNALETTDGTFLKYDYSFIPAKNGHKATYQQKTKTFLKSLNSPNKGQRPRIDLKAGFGAFGIFADFDNLEDACSFIPYGRPNQTWVDVRNYLQARFWNACLMPSSNGKAKLFFPLSSPYPSSTKKSEQILNLLLGDDVWRGINPKDMNGRRYSFIDIVAYDLLYTYLNNKDYNTALQYNDMLVNNIVKNYMKFQPIKREDSKDIVYTSNLKNKPTYNWKPYPGMISENMIDDILNKTKNRFCEGIIRCMLGYKTCIDDTRGIDLPVKVMAKALNTNIRQISQAIGELKGLCIKKVSNYQVGRKGNSYCFTGFWLCEAKRIIKEQAQNRLAHPGASCEGLKAILESIKPGHWNENLLPLTNYFHTKDEYLACVEKIPGYKNKPERDRQARNAWDCHVRRDAHKFEETEESA
jgi:hypothetical protein